MIIITANNLIGGNAMVEINKFLRNTIDYINDAVIAIDKKGNIVLINKSAEELMGVKEKEILGQDIILVIDNTKLLKTIETGKSEFLQYFTFQGREFMVDRIPLTNEEEEIYGAVAIFHDVTDFRIMKKQINDDKDYIDLVDTMVNAFNEWYVVVDSKGIINMMSHGYRQFINVDNPVGKHVTDVIENTRMHKVLQTGIMEVGEIQEVNGKRMISMRIPIKKDNKVVGAVGKVMFKDVSDFIALGKKINKLEKEIAYYKNELNEERVAKYSFDTLVGKSESLEKVMGIAKKVAKTNSNVLITGESGTGKELFAHAIHNASSRYFAPFIKINCAAIPSELLESELFGYEDGAFTGAKKGGKMGKFELANGGTILLDEIGDMPLDMQAKLLRVLQEKEVERLGGNVVRRIDVRIIASTNKELEKLVNRDKFREDLYYRLNVMALKLPPLRERKGDVRLLADELRKKIADRIGVYVEGISDEAMTVLEGYDWPGNIRELENIIERAINLLDSDLIIKPDNLPQRINSKKHRVTNNHDGKSLKEVVEDMEKKIIVECLEKNKGNKNRTAKELGISRVGLYKKIDRYNIPHDFN